MVVSPVEVVVKRENKGDLEVLSSRLRGRLAARYRFAMKVPMRRIRLAGGIRKSEVAKDAAHMPANRNRLVKNIAQLKGTR